VSLAWLDTSSFVRLAECSQKIETDTSTRELVPRGLECTFVEAYKDGEPTRPQSWLLQIHWTNNRSLRPSKPIEPRVTMHFSPLALYVYSHLHTACSMLFLY
jgi:hypothetical protein